MQFLNTIMASAADDLQSARYQKIGDNRFQPIPNGSWRRGGISRLKIALCFPLELLASLENAAASSFQAGGMLLKGVVIKPLRAVKPHSQIIKKWDDSLPGINEISHSAAKAIGYFTGAFATLVVGLIAPAVNIRLHQKVCLYAGQTSKEKMDRQFRKAAEAADAAKVQAKLNELWSGRNYAALAEKHIRLFNETMGTSSEIAEENSGAVEAAQRPERELKQETEMQPEAACSQEGGGSQTTLDNLSGSGSVTLTNEQELGQHSEQTMAEDPFYVLDHADEFQATEPSLFATITNWFYGP